MNKSGIGSASLILIFSVLCLAVFSLIAYTAAENEMALAKAEAALVIGYYEADAYLELLVAELIAGDRDSEIYELTQTVSCGKELYVKICFLENTYDIQAWGLRNTKEWFPDLRIPVWNGD